MCSVTATVGTTAKGIGGERRQPMPIFGEAKKTLHEAGFLVYRTRASVIHLAERVRENLIMDSGVTLDASDLRVAFAVRAQRSEVGDLPDLEMFARARDLAYAAVARGYTEARSGLRDVPDPGDPSRTLDVWYEVTYEKRVDDMGEAMDELRFLLSLEKSAAPA